MCFWFSIIFVFELQIKIIVLDYKKKVFHNWKTFKVNIIIIIFFFSNEKQDGVEFFIFNFPLPVKLLFLIPQ